MNDPQEAQLAPGRRRSLHRDRDRDEIRPVHQNYADDKVVVDVGAVR